MRIILVGKAASGKDYLRDMLTEEGLTPDVSYTSRPPREGEEDGVAYNFISDMEFSTLVRRGKMHEHVEFNGWQYGTTNVSWRNSDVFIMTPSGINQISREDRNDCVVVYIDIPLDIRRSRLMERSDSDKVERRILADEEDFKGFTDYDIQILDENFDVKIARVVKEFASNA